MQTTEWSACSKSCGMGISARVTNDNPQCRLEKETRLCMVRPCDFPMEKTKVLGLGERGHDTGSARDNLVRYVLGMSLSHRVCSVLPLFLCPTAQ